MTRTGIVLPQQSANVSDVIDAAKQAEEAGLSHVWLADHLRGRPDPSRPFLECWSCLSAVAAATHRIGLGTLVLRASLRNPVLVASMVRTLAMIAPDRLTVGIGAGDVTIREEQTSAGIPLLPRRERLESMARLLETIREGTPSVPLWLGGREKRILDMLPLVQGWNYWGPASRFGASAELARDRANPGCEISWAGSIKEFDWKTIAPSQPHHVILATSAESYRDRIAFLKAFDFYERAELADE